MAEPIELKVCRGERLRVRLLGDFAAVQNGRTLNLPTDAQRLLAFLGLRRGQHARATVAGHLWLDCPQTQAFASLRSALWRVRRASERFVNADARTLKLAEDVHVDTDVLESAAAALREHRDIEATDHSLFVQDLLIGWHDEWALVERERFRQISLHGLEALSDQMCQRGDHAAAIDSALAAVALDPLRESSHRCLISVHLAEGNRSQAIRIAERYRTRLRYELDVEPSPMLSTLMQMQPA